jgi:hypothetical protein
MITNSDHGVRNAACEWLRSVSAVAVIARNVLVLSGTAGVPGIGHDSDEPGPVLVPSGGVSDAALPPGIRSLLSG